MEKLKLLVQGVLVVGVLALIIFGFGWATYLENETERTARQLLEECELNLPRTERCELSAKPVTSK